MAAKRYKRNNNQTNRGGRRHTKTQKTKKKRNHAKKWVTAVSAAEATLKRSGSYEQARATLRIQALRNARRLFGSVGEML